MKLYSGTQADYDSGIVSDNRSWSASVLCLYDGVWQEIEQDCVKSFTLSDYATDGSNISMGIVCGGKLTLSLMELNSTHSLWLTEGARIKLSLTLNNADTVIRSVTFVVDKNKLTKRNNGLFDASVTAYDLSYTMTKKYVASSNSLTCPQIVEEIANKYGLTVDSSVSEAVALIDGATPAGFTPLADYTDKQTLGYMAGCYGCFAYVNENDSICFGWYVSTSDTIAPDRIFDGGEYISEMEARTIKMIETGTNDNVIVAPSSATGHSINFENPYITQSQADAIYNNRISGNAIAFRIGKIKYKGNPLNKPGTVVTVEDVDSVTAPFYIMKRTLRFDGGLSETIECHGDSATTTSFKSASPIQQKINRALSRMEEAISKATNIISATKGSIFEFIPIDESDLSKGNSGYKLYSQYNNNVILANSNGIGFSSDGGDSFNAVAIYIDEDGIGHINANCITAGKMSGDYIEADTITSAHIKSEAITAKHIKAGTITADKLIIGDFTNYNQANSETKEIWGFETTLTGFITPKSYSSRTDMSPWYDYQEGLSFVLSGQIATDASYNGSYCRAQVTLRVLFSDNTEADCVENAGAGYVDGTSTYPTTDVKWIITPSKLNTSSKTVKKFKVVFRYANNVVPDKGRSHIRDVVVRAINNDAGTIVAGKLQSADGDTYFDLENSKVVTVKRTSSAEYPNYSFEYHGGGITGRYNASEGSCTLVGGIFPYSWAGTTSNMFEWFSKQLIIGCSSDGTIDTFDPYITFYNDGKLMTFNKPVYIADGTNEAMIHTEGYITTNTERFAGLEHTRNYTKNGVTSSGTLKAGVGVNDKINGISSDVLLRSDLVKKTYSGYTYYTAKMDTSGNKRLTNWISTNGALTLSLAFNYNSYGYADFFIGYQTQEYVEAGTYAGLSSFLKSTKGDNDNTDGYYYGTLSIPSDAVKIAIFAVPENVHSTYWVGWRNVTADLFYGTKLSASLELLSGETTAARIDVIEPDGEAIGALKLTSTKGSSPILELGAYEIWYSGIGILGELEDLRNRVAALEQA